MYLPTSVITTSSEKVNAAILNNDCETSGPRPYRRQLSPNELSRPWLKGTY
jgi:hypothetical protein